MTTPGQQTVTSLNDYVVEEIRVLLTRRRMSQRQLATKLGVSPAWVNYRLTGVQAIDLNDIQRFAEVLDVQVVDLLPKAGVANTLRNADLAERPSSEPVSPTRPPRAPRRQHTHPDRGTPKETTRRPAWRSRPIHA